MHGLNTYPDDRETRPTRRARTAHAGERPPRQRGIREDTMSNRYPKGYWSLVFDQATFLMNQRGSLSGETAYWLARRMVDRGLTQEGINLPNTTTEFNGGTLVLSP